MRSNWKISAFLSKQLFEDYLLRAKAYSDMWEYCPVGPLDLRILFRKEHSELEVFLQKLLNLPDSYDDEGDTKFHIIRSLVCFYLFDVSDIHAAFKCATESMKKMREKFPTEVNTIQATFHFLRLKIKITSSLFFPCNVKFQNYQVSLPRSLC